MDDKDGTEARERLRQDILGLGFVACGFAAARLPSPVASRLSDWIDAGRHGAMDYLEIEPKRRTQADSWVEGARTVILAAWPYPAPPPPRADWREKLLGRIGAYAAGTDYHNRLTELLEPVAEDLRTRLAASARLHVDAGPLLEKDFARQAGLGWFGRHTNILLQPNPAGRSGSWILLAAIVTNLELPPDPPFLADHCGRCTACLPACPTAAIDGSATIDASRCISHLSLELRGPIPLNLRGLMGNWVAGCDLCQEACPWNEDAGTGSSEDSGSGAGGTAGNSAETAAFLQPSLPGLLELTPAGFRERYRHTAVARAKRRGLARNAAVALGNTANPAALTALARALSEHDEALVRAHSAWAIGALAASGAVQPARANAVLSRVGAAETVPPVLAEIEAARASIHATKAT